MVDKLKEELFHLTQLVSGIASQDAYPDLSASPAFIELYRYQVPVDRKLIFRPEHTFALLARKLPDQPVDGAVFDNGGVETIEVVEANNVAANDINLKDAVPAVADAYYFGYKYRFSGLTLKYSTAATAGTIVWEYWTGAAWVALPGISDLTLSYVAVAGTYDVTWTMPRDWAAGGSGDLGTTPPSMFWVRARVTVAGDVATGDQAWIHPDPTAMDLVDLVRVEVRDASELARRPLIDGAMYDVVDDFTDKDSMYKFDIAEPVEAQPGCWVVILVKAKSPIDVSAGYFDLTCDRVRHAII